MQVSCIISIATVQIGEYSTKKGKKRKGGGCLIERHREAERESRLVDPAAYANERDWMKGALLFQGRKRFVLGR